MTLAEFAAVCQTNVCAKSAFNGKILCRAFDSKKHAELGIREVVSVWSEINVDTIGYLSTARAVIMVFVDGMPECEKALAEAKAKLNGRTADA